MKRVFSIVLSFVLLLGLWGCETAGEATDSTVSVRTTMIRAYTDEDGDAYIPLMDGTCVTIHDDTTGAILTPDWARIVVLLKDSSLYYTDVEQNEKIQVSDKAAVIKYDDVKSDGFFFCRRQRGCVPCFVLGRELGGAWPCGGLCCRG